MAQAALESGWGKYAIGNNLFGVKAFDDWMGNGAQNRKEYIETELNKLKNEK